MPERINLKKLATIIAGLAAGVILFFFFVAHRQHPTHGEVSPAVPTLTVIEAELLPFKLKASGNGVAQPAETWQAVANVAGEVIEKHPRLESGHLLPEGTLLLALDPSRYELAIAAAEAEIATLQAEQMQIETENDNTTRLLGLEQGRLVLVEKELSRIKTLAGSGAVSQSQLDEQLRATLQQRQAVTTLENQQRLFSARRTRLDAQIQRGVSLLDQARQDLEDTRFIAPYDLRLGEVEAALHQYVAPGQRLFAADNIEAAEIEARIPLSSLRRLLPAVMRSERHPDALDIGDIIDFSAIDAQVTLVGVPGTAWPGRVARIASGLDPATRTARVVIEVEQPYRHAAPPARPILQRDMFVRVELTAAAPRPLLALPATAVHQGEIYLVDEQNRLRRRSVTVDFRQQDLAVIAAGVEPGELVIVDDPGLALEGMPLQPQMDRDLAALLRRRALGDEQ